MTAPDELTPQQEERLARYRAGVMPAAERAEFEREVLASDALCEALYGEESLDALAAEARAAEKVLDARPALTARPRRGWSWGFTRVLLPAAAAVAVLVGVFRWTGRERGAPPGEDIVRGAGAQALPLEPTGEVASPPQRFVWSRDPGAQSYRVELFAPDGSVLGSAVTADTTLGYSALAQAPVAAGEWQVVPLDADGLERPGAPRAAFHARAP
jgi:hypothetical protein